jgi:hypothetical protein
MHTPGRSRVTYANVVATLALFFALGGTAAGAKVWITGADIKDRSLTGADVADRSLSARKLRLASISGSTVLDGSLRAADFDPAELAAMAGPAGPVGPAGAKGDQGPKGDPGDSGIVRLSAKGSDVTNYVDGAVLASKTVTADGGWLVWARLDVTNTSATDDSFNCGLFVNGQGFGGGGDWIPAGTTKLINTVGFGPADTGRPVELWCDGGGSATFDVAGVHMSLAKLM